MSTGAVRVPAFAKINLDLRVLQKRADGFHELRTVFQTISLRDEIEIEFTPARRTDIAISGSVTIRDNLMERAARLCLDAMRVHGKVRMRLHKSIPMGAGLGGGSSDAAAVLLALPVLAGDAIASGKLFEIAAQLGSDVPFFLFGGTAVGVGRGEEFYPLPDAKLGPGLLVASGVHVSTAEAYRLVSESLRPGSAAGALSAFQAQIWRTAETVAQNDFEPAVFARHPELKKLKAKLASLGANPAMMTGSGSAIYGFFPDKKSASAAASGLVKSSQSMKQSLRDIRVIPISLVSRARYQSTWLRRLRPHIQGDQWPPRNQSAR